MGYAVSLHLVAGLLWTKCARGGVDVAKTLRRCCVDVA